MSTNYQAFIRWLESCGSNQQEFEDELEHCGTSLHDFKEKLNNCIKHNRNWGSLWGAPNAFFVFSLSIKPDGYWDGIFNISGNNVAVNEVLEPFMEEPLTNEQIYVQFLKSKRSFAKAKRILNDPSCIVRGGRRIAVEDAMAYHNSSLYKLENEWVKLCTHFNLKGVVDLRKVASMR